MLFKKGEDKLFDIIKYMGKTLLDRCTMNKNESPIQDIEGLLESFITNLNKCYVLSIDQEDLFMVALCHFKISKTIDNNFNSLRKLQPVLIALAHGNLRLIDKVLIRKSSPISQILDEYFNLSDQIKFGKREVYLKDKDSQALEILEIWEPLLDTYLRMVTKYG